MTSPTQSSGGLDGRWYCPDCDDAHDGPCPATYRPTLADRLLDRTVRRRRRPHRTQEH